jgi:hypothetical protein
MGSCQLGVNFVVFVIFVVGLFDELARASLGLGMGLDVFDGY